ncbi:hypothetical protein [Autumnicola edwardsiae]|uniref:Uncharacterized protein n=1 Tax=Autumnicola edwardsiae TaxID=3075594 RepID=A0ABU3CUZ5_9FLAO|nr:hypothetical protein [Zunongwangia sp. F297]MDT0650183.1 hypothetical protein [Zunongwangia sp. F297]
MGSLTISKKILDKYFGYLKNLDNNAKQNLITKLTESIETKAKKKSELRSFFGAWDDNRDSDEIISEIRAFRVNKMNTESFE